MAGKIIFEELGVKERTLLLRAFGYDVDEEGYILTPNHVKILSKEVPKSFLRVENTLLTPGGSLEILDGSTTSVSKFIIERVEKDANNR
jgi:hypothetical protein